MKLSAPFPYFGGKSKIAPLIWQYLGDVDNYVEPFMGSLAVLLARPAEHRRKVETVNDIDHYLCVGPETRILRADLRWIHARDVRVGDHLVGFDESNGLPQVGIERRVDRPEFQPPQRMRRWQVATVTAVRRVKRECYRLRFDDGTTIVASEDHLWLAGKSVAGGRGARWIETKRMRADKSAYRTHVVKLCDVVEQENTVDAGWVGGFYDGEGSIQGKGSGWRISVSQKLGPEIDRVEKWLVGHGFRTFRRVAERANPKHQPLAFVQINGGMRESLRFLMLSRPERLIRNAVSRLHARSIYGRKRQVVGLVEKTYIGQAEVVAIETDTHTYVAEGLASHNCNFWRAVQAAPDEVARWADWPVNECDLTARHLWLVNEGRERIANLEADPFAYDAQVAGWWLWGICSWIAGGWCSGTGPWVKTESGELVKRSRGERTGQGISRRLPSLKNAGMGINRERPHLNTGQGVNRKLPHLRDAGKGINRQRTEQISDYMHALAARLRNVRVCCGDWRRVVTPGALVYGATVGIFLDPPYSISTGRDKGVYNCDSEVSAAVREWAIANGDNPRYRIALCGYEGEHVMPETWLKVSWTASVGYKSHRGDQTGNRYRERVWFSPHCLRPLL